MSTPRKKILLVEDEPNMRELVKARLEHHGYEVTVVGDGYQAIFTARQVKPDLIILDLMIPRMDGYTVCRTLKSSSDLNNIPIIMFTARTSPDDRRRGTEMGADAYLTKPFVPETLLAKIEELLTRTGTEPTPDQTTGEAGPPPDTQAEKKSESDKLEAVPKPAVTTAPEEKGLDQPTEQIRTTEEQLQRLAEETQKLHQLRHELESQLKTRQTTSNQISEPIQTKIEEELKKLTDQVQQIQEKRQQLEAALAALKQRQ